MRPSVLASQAAPANRFRAKVVVGKLAAQAAFQKLIDDLAEGGWFAGTRYDGDAIEFSLGYRQSAVRLESSPAPQLSVMFTRALRQRLNVAAPRVLVVTGNVDPHTLSELWRTLSEYAELTLVPGIGSAQGRLDTEGRLEYDLVIVYSELGNTGENPPEVTFAQEIWDKLDGIVLFTSPDQDLVDRFPRRERLAACDIEGLPAEAFNVIRPLAAENIINPFGG
jgi:hypothetical protein